MTKVAASEVNVPPVPPERLQHLLDAVISIAEPLGTQSALDRIVTAARTLVPCAYAAVDLRDSDGGFAHFAHAGADAQTIEAIGAEPASRDALGRLIGEPRAVRVHDVRRLDASAGLPPGHPFSGPLLSVPVRVRDMAHGSLYLTEREGGDFNQHDERLLLTLSAAAGIAIENAIRFEEGLHRASWLQACAGLARDILAPVDGGEEAVLKLAAQRASHEAEVATAAVALPVDEPRRVLIVAAAGSRSSTIVGRSAVLRPAIMTPISSGEPVLVPSPKDVCLDDAREPTNAEMQAAYGWTLVTPLGLPLTGRHGVLLLFRPTGAHAFSAVDVEMSSMFGSIVALALELGRRNLAQRQEAVSGDRERIAEDLHDVVIQRIYAAAFSLEHLGHLTSDPEITERINAVNGELDATISELRDTIDSLRGVSPGWASLSNRIRAAIEAGTDGRAYRRRIRLSGPIDALAEALGNNMIAVISEGLSNVNRHSNATAVEVSVTVSRGRARVVVADNGGGLTGTLPLSGLENLASRAKASGGRFHVKSDPDQGTRLLWSAPVAGT